MAARMRAFASSVLETTFRWCPAGAVATSALTCPEPSTLQIGTCPREGQPGGCHVHAIMA